MMRWIRRPIPMLEDYRARYGDVFTVRFPAMAPMVLFSHPDAVKEIFTASPDLLRAGEANVILEPFLGSNSLLLMDGARHKRERKLLMPPFHGERMRLYKIGEAVWAPAETHGGAAIDVAQECLVMEIELL